MYRAVSSCGKAGGVLRQPLTRVCGNGRVLAKANARGYFSSRLTESSDSIIWGLMAVNGGILCLWQTANTYEKQRFMFQHFTTSYMHIESGKLHTLLTAAFSHRDPMHFVINCVGMYFFGRPALYILGPKRFLSLYMGSAAIASMTEVAFNKYKREPNVMLGASGAVNAITSFTILTNPYATMLIFGILPIPAYIGGTMFVLRDLWGASSNTRSNIGHAAHLGGAACGALYFQYLFKGRRGRFF